MRPQRAHFWRVVSVLRIILASFLFLPFICGCHEEEVQISHSVQPIKNPYLASDPIERQIEALAHIWGADWYAPADYFSPVGSFHAPSGNFALPNTRGSTAALLRPLIAEAPASLPHLIAHLGDSRKIGLSVELGSFDGMVWSGEYDTGFDRVPDTLGDHDGSVRRPQRHAITVGDLCFFAIGQIVDRDFEPVRLVWTWVVDIS